MERAIVQVLAAFRWAAWAWMAAVLLVSRHDLLRPWLAVLLVGAALAVTAAATWAFRQRMELALAPGLVGAELAVGAALVLCDGWAYGGGHAFSTSQSLGSVWPLVGILAAGVAVGPWAGLVAGGLLGAARVGATFANGIRTFDTGRVLSLTNTVFLYCLAGVAAGAVARLLRRSEREISAARAREELTRTLHDGVLQTLAVVERRAEDPALARLAREQERELRAFLYGQRPAGTSRDLGTALRATAARFEDHFGGRVDVIVADDVPAASPERVEALAAAVGEALVNAGKHGRATVVTVYVEPADEGGLFCSVKDNGGGFDVAATPEGIGLSTSIRGRIEELSGSVEVVSRPTAGTEVCLWLP
jgi:signal transduction histidine kinase